MFGKKNEKLETLKDLIGTRAGYLETVGMLELKGIEKDLFMRASLEVNKSTPNLAIIEQAHAILIRKSFQGETGEVLDNNTSNNDDSSKLKASSDTHTPKGDAPTASRHASYASNAEDDVKNYINYGSLNYKPQRKSYIKYIAIAVVVVGVYSMMNNTSELEENTVESKIQEHGYSKVSYSSKKTVDEVIADANKKMIEADKDHKKTNISTPLKGFSSNRFANAKEAMNYVNKISCSNGQVIKDSSMLKWLNNKRNYITIDGNNPFTGCLITYNSNGNKLKHYTYKNGQGNGVWMMAYKTSGTVKNISIFQNMKNVGAAFSFYENGNIKEIGVFKHAKLDKEIKFNEYGKKRSEKNLPNGLHKFWYKNGQLEEEAIYSNGRPAGLHTTWYKNGYKKSESYYNNGKLNGKYTLWHDNGQKSSETHYVKDKEVGTSIHWDKKGHMERKVTFHNGKVIDIINYD